MSESISTDPRIKRTRSSLQHALLELCKDRDLESVSVSEVAEAAGVNRTTFYQHYPDINTLLADAIDSIAAGAHAQLDVGAEPGTPASPREVISKFMQHVYENRTLYRKVLGEAGSPVIVERLTQRATSMAEAGMRAVGTPETGMPITIAAASVAGSFIAIVRAWLRMKPMPSAETATDWALAALSPAEQTVTQKRGT